VIALPGHTPISALTKVDTPELVTVEPPRIPKLQAVPNGTVPEQATVDVVKVHT
jgi:hypothetical protein